MTSMKPVVTALAYFAGIAISNAAELAPGSAYSIRLSSFQGVVYHSIEPDGYRVVVTLASDIAGSPIRLVAILGPGQRAVISVPQSVGQPSIDFEIIRNGDVLSVSEPESAEQPKLLDHIQPHTVSGE